MSETPAQPNVVEVTAENFEREGRRLWRAVRAELSGVYEVGYFSQTLHRQVWEPDELEAGTHRGG